MSTVTCRKPGINPELEPVEMWMGNGLPALGPGEAIPLRLSPAEAAELARVGHLGDAPAEPVRFASGELDPDQARTYVERLTADEPDRLNRAWQECGAWYGQYRALWRLYQSKLQELADRSAEFWPDDVPVADWVPGDDELASTES